MEEESIKKMQEQGPKDLTYHINEPGEYREAWRIFRIMAEFVEGYQFLSSLDKEVTILGSARLKSSDPYYKAARTFGGLLAEHGYTTITGGGPGIMEAANRGAYEKGGESIGLNIQLPFEQRINKYVKKSAAFYYFFTRKAMLTAPAHSFVFFPGGFGTMDEFFEVVDHMNLGKMCPVPVILYGSEFWNPILDFLKHKSCHLLGSLEEKQIEEWNLVDDPEEALKALEHEDFSYKSCELSALNFHSNTPNVDWRIFRIMAELVEGFEFLTGLSGEVTVLGTKSVKPGSKYYEAAHSLGQKLAEEGYAVLTGGASGIAEAANRGAFEVGGQSIGVGMEVNGKARINPYVNKSIMFSFPFTRKLIVTAPSTAFVFFPGGFGTMHQLFEVLTLIQTKKTAQMPIILFDSEYWDAFDSIIQSLFVDEFKTIKDTDDDLYTIVDSVEEIISVVNRFNHKKTS